MLHRMKKKNDINAGKWIGVGGKFEVEEGPIDCLLREAEEETGLRAQRWQPLTVLLTTPGFSSERIALYLATGLSAAKAHPDEDEFLDVVRMPLGEAIDRVMRGELCDGKSAVGLLMAGRLLG